MNKELLVSDGMGGFIYVSKSTEDENFINIRMETENENEEYDSMTIELYKGDVVELINILNYFLI